MNFQENSDQHPQDFLYRLLTAAVFIVFFAFCVLMIMNASGSFERTDDSRAVDNELMLSVPDDDIPVQGNPELADSAETTAAETNPPPVTVAPDIVAAYDPGPVNKSAAFTSTLASLYPNTVLAVTDDAGKDYLSKIIFLGDSTTYGLKSYGMLTAGKDTTQVWTPASGTLTLSQTGIATIVYPNTKEELLISEAIERSHPEIMVITLGVNGVSFMKEDYFKSEYKKLVQNIQKISPDTKIILQSIFPVAASYKNQDQINNDKINAANLWILDIAAECGVKYLDTASALVGSDGYLPESLHNGGDGMHLNADGFKIELDYIRTHAYN